MPRRRHVSLSLSLALRLLLLLLLLLLLALSSHGGARATPTPCCSANARDVRGGGWVVAGSKAFACPTTTTTTGTGTERRATIVLTESECKCVGLGPGDIANANANASSTACPPASASTPTSTTSTNTDFECPPSRANANNRKTIPLSRVNDDYCDCGWDEPNTPACAGFRSAPALFVCGHNEESRVALHPSRVRDGIVDCCDCADEPNATCAPDACDRVATERRASREKRARVVADGLAALATISAAAPASVAQLKREKDAACAFEGVPSQADLDALRATEASENAAEIAEHEKLRSATGPLAQALGLASDDTSLLASVAAKMATQQGKEKAKELIEAVRAAEPAFVDGRDPASVAEQACAAPPEAAVDTLNLRGAPRDVLWKFVVGPSNDFRRVVEAVGGRDLSTDTALAAALQQAESPPPREATRKARDAVTVANARRTDAKNKCDALTKVTDVDWGVNGTLIHLRDKELSLKSGEFTYVVRGFDAVRQGHTLVGKYTSWSAVQAGAKEDKMPQEMDEGADAPAPTLKVSYLDGDRCWNGPARSAVVYLRCGATDEILRVVEPEMCRYLFLQQSPVACLDASDIALASAVGSGSGLGAMFSRFLRRLGWA